MPKYVFKEKEWLKLSEEYTDATLIGINDRKYKQVKHRGIRGSKPLLPGTDTIDTWIGLNVFGPGGYYESHKHETSQFFYVLYGKGLVKVGDEERIVEKGTWVFTPPGIEHYVKNIGDEDFAYILIGGNPKRKESKAHQVIERKKSAQS